MRLLITTLLLGGFLALQSQSDTVVVTVTNNQSFEPRNIVIKAGQTVLWKNAGSLNNINGEQKLYAGNPRSFSNGNASDGAWEFAYTFEKTGYYQYQSDPNINAGMKGSVNVLADLIITEIMYNPPESGADLFEYIELYNNGPTAINLKDHRLVDGVSFTFPGYVLGEGEYVIIAENAEEMSGNFDVGDVFEWQGSLNNNGEPIALFNPDGDLIDEVIYNSGNGWPTDANGNGSAIVLCNLQGDNNNPENWKAATTPTGVISNGVEILGNPGASSQCAGSAVIRFVGSEVQVEEDAKKIIVKVVLIGGSEATRFTISTDANSSSASYPVDYHFSGLSPTFAGGSPSDTLSITVPIIDDDLAESTETIILKLTNPGSGASVDSRFDTYTIKIIDNEVNIPDIVISEILYNSPDEQDAYEFIELYNNDEITVNLDGYYFSQGINFNFPAIELSPGEFLVIAKDAELIENTFEIPALQWTSDNLSNNGEVIELRSPDNHTIDFVSYSNSAPWDEMANGMGPSLDICNVGSDNNLSNSWKAGVSSTGVEVDGMEILASPGELRAVCRESKRSKYPAYPIGLVTTVDAEGVADSIAVRATLQGTVHGINFNAINDGLSFTIIDGPGDGIQVFSRDNFDYEVTEGDEVQVKGIIDQFNGMIEIEPDSLFLISTGNPLVNPSFTNELGEDTESQLVKLEGLRLVNPAEWTNVNTRFDVEVTNGTNTFVMRIDVDTDIFGTSPPVGTFNLTGIGSQFDRNFPFNSGYQIIPRYLTDIDLATSTVDHSLKKSIQVFPNPVHSTLNIRTSEKFDRIFLSNFLGQKMVEFQNIEGALQHQVAEYTPGMYSITFQKGASIWTEKILLSGR